MANDLPPPPRPPSSTDKATASSLWAQSMCDDGTFGRNRLFHSSQTCVNTPTPLITLTPSFCQLNSPTVPMLSFLDTIFLWTSPKNFSISILTVSEKSPSGHKCAALMRYLNGRQPPAFRYKNSRMHMPCADKSWLDVARPTRKWRVLAVMQALKVTWLPPGR